MIIRRTSEYAITKAAAQTGVTAVWERMGNSRGGGETFRVKVDLGPDRDRYRKINNRQRVNAVCWHGFRDFFRALFEVTPDAIAKTALDTWAGGEDFEARYRSSAWANWGSVMEPLYACEACACPEAGEGE